MVRFVLAAVAIAVVVLPSSAQENASPEKLEERIAELRASGMYSDAADLGAELLSIRCSDSEVRPDQIVTAEWLVRTLEQAASLPEADRLELARADSLTGLLEELKRTVEVRDDAVYLAEWQLSARRRILGESHPDVAESCLYLAMMLDRSGDTERPGELFDEALRTYREVYGDRHPAVVQTHAYKAYLFVKRQDFAAAESHYRDALQAARTTYGERHSEVAGVALDLGRVLGNQGRWEEAEGIIAEAVSIYRESDVSVDGELARALKTLGLLQIVTGDHSSANSNLLEALDLVKREHGEEHPDVADFLHALAASAFMRGDYERAEELNEQELALRDKLEGVDESGPSLSNLQNNATFQSFRGNLGAAEALLREVLSMQREAHRGDHEDVAATLEWLGDILAQQGDYASAGPLLTEALEMRLRLFGDEHISIASSLSELGNLLQNQGDFEEAEQLYREALEMTRAVNGESGAGVTDCLIDLGSVLQELGKLDEAEAVLTQALDCEAGSPRQLLGLSGAQFSLAYVYIDRGDYESAEKLLREMEAVVRRIVGDEYYGLAELLCSLAQVCYLLGDYEEIEPLLTEAAEIFDSARQGVGPGVKRSTFMISPYPYLAAAELMRGRPERAWAALELGQARALSELLTVDGRSKWNSSELARADSLGAVMGELQGQLGAYEAAALDEPTDDVLERLEDTRNTLLAAEAAWGDLRLELAEKYEATTDEEPSLQRIQTCLDEHAAIVGWLDIEPRTGERWSWGYVIRDSGPVVWAAIDSALVAEPGRSITDRVRSLRRDLATQTTSPIGVSRDAHAIWEIRVKPLVDALGGVEELIVVPSGPMLGVSVEALVDAAGTWMGDKYSVSYAPSATVYAWLSERQEGESTHGAILVGDPVFSSACEGHSDRNEKAEASDAYPPVTALLRSALAGNEDALAALPRLRGTREEVTAVASILPESSILLGSEASEQEFVRLAESGEIERLRTIHIATHALVDGDRPERSALVLSQDGLPDPLEAANAGTRVYDGLLTAGEIGRDWRLNADLVTLSACETALGKEIEREGYIGFARTFLEVGARSLLVSLWKVDDEATSLLMTRFYENRQGAYEESRGWGPGKRISKSAALFEAKSWLRSYTNEQGAHPYEHPFYWSAFVLIGDRR